MYYGGLIGGTIGLYVFSKKERVPFFLSGDLAASVLPIVHAIGRIGCFLPAVATENRLMHGTA